MTQLRIHQDDSDALISDGRIVHLRDIGPGDHDELIALHARASDHSIYLRYFSGNRSSADQYIARLASPHDAKHHAIGAFAHDQLIGMSVFERIDAEKAEFALLVADDWQHAGVGTVLLEHLIAEARAAGINRFTGEVLASNAGMLTVMRDLGIPAEQKLDSGDVHVEFDLAIGDRLIEAISIREQVAGAASLRPLLDPRSIVVVGAGRRPGSVGHEVLRNVLKGGFRGPVYVVNPNASSVLDVPSFASPLDLPEPPDLAVIALPAERVADAVRACGERGCRAAVLLGGGFGEAGPDGAARQDEVVAIARRYGLRLVGPNCLGVANTDPDVRLDATFAVLSNRPGSLAVFAQSGAFGAAVLNAADQACVGVGQFVSIGNKADVGGNDLLLAWGADPRIRVIAAYLESVGDPRRFARIARAVSREKPIVAVKSGRTEVGQRAGRSHTAAAASSDVAIDALFRRAGVLRVHTMQELVDAARLLDAQPLPAGPRVAIVGNSGGPEILAADALSDAGLTVAEFDAQTVAALQAMGVPALDPLDLGAAVQSGQLAEVLRTVAASPSVDAVLVVLTDIAVTNDEELRRSVCAVAAEAGKTFVLVAVGALPTTLPLLGTGASLPVFAFPEPAAAALGVAYRHVRAQASDVGSVIRPAGVDVATARAAVTAALDAGREWLPPDEVYQLLASYGLPACPQALVDDADAAVRAAAQLGYPLAVKLGGAGLHKSDLGGVRLGIADETELRGTVDELARLAAGPILLQPMVRAGTELIVGSVHDAQCGPMVMLGAGGVLTDVLGDRSFGLAPMTAGQADDLIDGLRSARLLDGYRGAPVVSRDAIQDILVRVGTLVDDLPEIAELDLNPLVCRADGVTIVDARVRIAPAPVHPDPLVRQLRGPRAPSGTAS